MVKLQEQIMLRKEYIETYNCHLPDMTAEQIQEFKDHIDTAISALTPPPNAYEHNITWTKRKDSDYDYTAIISCRYTLDIADKSEYVPALDEEIYRYIRICRNTFMAISSEEIYGYDGLNKKENSRSVGMSQIMWLR